MCSRQPRLRPHCELFHLLASEACFCLFRSSFVAPTSRGNVTISSASMEAPPIINPNWLATETDQKVAVAAYKRIRAAFDSDAMQSVRTGPEYFPELKHQTEADILNLIRNTVMTIYHAACTCKMGLRNDTMAVVDHKAQVNGVHGLRVSSLGRVSSTNSLTDMLAEKIAADIITAADTESQ